MTKCFPGATILELKRSKQAIDSAQISRIKNEKSD